MLESKKAVQGGWAVLKLFNSCTGIYFADASVPVAQGHKGRVQQLGKVERACRYLHSSVN